jgi:hypothetical protein
VVRRGWKALNRQKDGLIICFGKHDVTKIITGMVREYLLLLDDNREKPLAHSTKSEHLVIIRKVLSLAVEDGLMNQLPLMPKIKTVDTPRHAFTDGEYRAALNRPPGVFLKSGYESVSCPFFQGENTKENIGISIKRGARCSQLVDVATISDISCCPTAATRVTASLHKGDYHDTRKTVRTRSR